jgi:hypothetical protein
MLECSPGAAACIGHSVDVRRLLAGRQGLHVDVLRLLAGCQGLHILSSCVFMGEVKMDLKGIRGTGSNCLRHFV